MRLEIPKQDWFISTRTAINWRVTFLNPWILMYVQRKVMYVGSWAVAVAFFSHGFRNSHFGTFLGPQNPPMWNFAKKMRLLNSAPWPFFVQEITSARSDQGLTPKPTSNYTRTDCSGKKSGSGPSSMSPMHHRLPSSWFFAHFPPQTSKSHNNAQWN